MGFFKSLFSSANDKPLRKVEHVSQLQKGDAVEFSDTFALPELLRKQTFVVEDVNTYQFEHKANNEFVLQGTTSEKVYLSYEKDDEEWLNISLKINREQVAILFNLEQFAAMFEEGSAGELNLIEQPNQFDNWLAPIYFRHSFAATGFFYNKDFRPGKPPSYQDDASLELNYFGLSSADEKYSVEMEVWPDGDTDVMLTIHRPMSDVIAMYPGEA
ncbi:hypothetical protein C2869_10300 [Saccharobesus litoralis]|uniref:DUF4178 domain-containing protein n=1 Tax=Saccharobesus litoralis TaxID=2172099 RepID=A0A2S0VRH0_9ALTE|nr:hypothetical protein [Saccharobesus litoralis]AWB66794.1 hypothetical protein C2869_10300 [Saccharobesus litoralis]